MLRKQDPYDKFFVVCVARATANRYRQTVRVQEELMTKTKRTTSRTGSIELDLCDGERSELNGEVSRCSSFVLGAEELGHNPLD